MDETGLLILGLIWAILCLVLFFKVWGACDNIKRLTDKYASENEEESAHSAQTPKTTGESVLLKSTPETREDIDNWLTEE